MEKIIQKGYIHYKLSDILKNNFLSENFGTFQISNGIRNEELLNFVDKIFEDLSVQKYKKNKIDKSIFEINDINNAYKLIYKTPFKWLQILNIFVIDTYNSNSLGYSLADEEDFTFFTKNKILYSGIIICNPEKNNKIRNTIYHELKHLYRYFKIYSSNHAVNDKDVIVSNISHTYTNLENDEIFNKLKNVNNKTAIYSILRNFLLDCLYYLNDEELAAAQENLFCEFNDNISKNKNISYEVCCKISKHYNIFNNIKEILEYCIENKIFCNEEILDTFLKNYIQRDIFRFKKAFNTKNGERQDKINLMFIYKKFLKKVNVGLKHTKQIYNFLKL